MTEIFELKLRDRSDGIGVSREDVKRIADRLEVDENMAIHIAVARLRRDLFGGDSLLAHFADDLD